MGSRLGGKMTTIKVCTKPPAHGSDGMGTIVDFHQMERDLKHEAEVRKSSLMLKVLYGKLWSSKWYRFSKTDDQLEMSLKFISILGTLMWFGTILTLINTIVWFTVLPIAFAILVHLMFVSTAITIRHNMSKEAKDLWKTADDKIKAKMKLFEEL